MISRVLVCLLASIVLQAVTGCYYLQAARGQMEIVRKREPISSMVSATDTAPELGARLALVLEARQFSVDVLGLPDNGSYRTYTDLQREFVIWNVVAVPEFSVYPKTWCYPVAGCVSYRGYFSRRSAEKLANALRNDNYDVAFGGVVAYSTLGKFDDPILSTMMRWSDTELMGVMFHELAHQLLYIKDDTGFNESFATAVQEFGVERWLLSRGQTEELAAWRQTRELRTQFAALVAATRGDLEVLYAQPIDDSEMRRQKQRRLQQFAVDAKNLYATSASIAPEWLDSQLNNARLAATTLYEGRLPEFRAMLQECENELPCFYNAARTLADSI